MMRCEKDLIMWLMLTIMTGLGVIGFGSYFILNQIKNAILFLLCCYVLSIIFTRWIER